MRQRREQNDPFLISLNYGMRFEVFAKGPQPVSAQPKSNPARIQPGWRARFSTNTAPYLRPAPLRVASRPDATRTRTSPSLARRFIVLSPSWLGAQSRAFC
jgi:hypothetical protein